MKKFTTTLLLLFVVASTYTFGGWAKQSDIENETISTMFIEKISCGADCLEIPHGFINQYHKVFDVMTDDLANPNHELKSDVVACTDEADCISKEAAQVCPVSDSIFPYFVVRVADNSEVYCTRIVSYPQIPTGDKEVREDVVLKANYETAKGLKDADELAMNSALKAMNCGKRVKARLLLRNAPKGLNNGQKKQIITLYTDIQSLLEAGSLETAKVEMQAVTPDGVLITASDLVALIAELDGCK